MLWSKRLPSGEIFELVDTKPGGYLYHSSGLGEFWMTSDAVVHARIDAVATHTAETS